MSWQQLHCYPKKENIESLSDWLTSEGSVAITYTDAADQAIYEPKPDEILLWQDTKLTALFSAEYDIQKTLAKATVLFPDLIFTKDVLAEQNWIQAWMDSFKPMLFGRNTWIIPSHCEPLDKEANNILLDPGLAFGTGTHPTTALCLTWLDGHDLKNKTIIDYGCGSGILAIVAKKHGAKKVYAIDYDPQAIIATQENAKRNQVALECLSPEEIPDSLRADIIVANIILGPLLTLKPIFTQLLKENGLLILSGILSEQTQQLIQAYEENFSIGKIANQEEWSRVEMKKLS